MGQAKSNKQQRLAADAAFESHWNGRETFVLVNMPVDDCVAQILELIKEESRTAWFTALDTRKPHSGDQ